MLNNPQITQIDADRHRLLLLNFGSKILRHKRMVFSLRESAKSVDQKS
jgi:hypothetical protein